MLSQLARQVRPEALTAGSVALVALLSLASYFYILKPSLQEYRSLLRDSTTATAGLRSEGGRGAAPTLVALGQEVEALRTQLYGGSSAVPLREMESYVIQTLDRISARHDVELVGVRPREIGQVLMFDELPYDVEVTGSYPRLWDWLRDMETELRPMVVNSYELSRTQSADPVSLTLRLVAYRAREPGS